jgi:hypothetical protein
MIAHVAADSIKLIDHNLIRALEALRIILAQW